MAIAPKLEDEPAVAWIWSVRARAEQASPTAPTPGSEAPSSPGDQRLSPSNIARDRVITSSWNFKQRKFKFEFLERCVLNCGVLFLGILRVLYCGIFKNLHFKVLE